MGSSDIFAEKRKILLKQSEELLVLRERSIQNIGGCSNTYFTVLGVVSAGIIVLLENNDKNNCITILEHAILIILGSILFFYGETLRKKIWSFYINQIIYTRKLNLTRRYLVEDFNISRKILLPIKGDRPKFNQIGYLREKFSKNDVVNWLKWTNSIILVALCYELMILFQIIPFFIRIDSCIEFKLSFQQLFISTLIGIYFYIKNDEYDNMIIKKGKKKWRKEIKHKDL